VAVQVVHLLKQVAVVVREHFLLVGLTLQILALWVQVEQPLQVVHPTET
jgi:hypothetical protein